MPTLALAGDVMLGRGVDEALRGLAADAPWGDFLPVLRQCDLRIVNLECALTSSRTPWRHRKVFHFRGDPHDVEVLAAASIDACSLANNHVLDFEEEGLSETLETLDRYRIAHAGAGRDLDEARRPAILRAGTLQIGFIAITDNEPDFAARRDRPGTNYLPTDEPESLAILRDLVNAARTAGAQVIVLSNHWGPNMVERPPDAFRRFAHAAIELGVDVYFGHSAHVCQGVELHQGRPILYDTGDFLDDYAVDPVLRNDRSCLFVVRVGPTGPTEVELLPARLTYAHVARAGAEDREAILSRMQHLSREFGTELERRDGTLVLGCQQPSAFPQPRIPTWSSPRGTS